MGQAATRSRMRFLWAIAIAVVLIGILWAIVAGGSVNLTLWSLLLSEARSPGGFGTAALVADNSSLAGASAWVYIRDPDHAGGRPQPIGGPYASDGPVKMRGVVWSRDGSVAAVRAEVGISAGKHFARRFGAFLAAAYDYRENRVIIGEYGVSSPDAPRRWRSKSQTIAALLRQRGGEGQRVFTTPYDASGQPMSPSQRREFGTPPELQPEIVTLPPH
ncbi:MAG: hypothetical protein HY320_01775 [Armatimonadetes bacterium]|nr:hypothetical protein [Armatimonadota bacterium]